MGALSHDHRSATRRWIFSAVVGVVASIAAWCICAISFSLDAGDSATVAALVAALISGPAVAWASRDAYDARPGVEVPAPAAAPRSSTPRIVGLRPSVSDGFQFRAVTDAVTDAFASGKTVVLVGLGGVGKTQVAAALAQSALDRGDLDVLVWVPAGNRDTIVNTYADAAAILPNCYRNNKLESVSAVIAHLATTKDRWMVVVDDLRDPSDLAQLWPPSRSNGMVLVTTRRRDGSLARKNRTVIGVDVFSEAEAVGYLTDVLERPDPAAALSLANDLGRLPLALAQAAAFIRDRGLDIESYRRRLADRQRELADLLPDGTVHSDDYLLPVTATWSLSIAVADDLEPQGLAGPMLELLSLLSPDGIPLSVFASEFVVEYLKRHRTRTERRPIRSGDAQDAVQCLRRLSLVTMDNSAGVPTIRVHALLQRVVRERLDTQRLAEAELTNADALVDTWTVPEQPWELGPVLRANAAVLVSLAGDMLWQAKAHQLLFVIGRSTGGSGNELGAADHFRRLAEHARQRKDHPHADIIRFRRLAAYWRGEGGDPARALAEAKKLADDSNRELGADDVETLAAAAEVARWTGESGDLEGAVQAYLQVLPGYLQVLGADDPETLRQRSWMAYFRGEAGDRSGAARDFEELAADRARSLGPDHRDTLAARHLAARWRGLSGQYDSALGDLEALHSDYLRVFGPDHPDGFHTRHTLARMKGLRGDPAEATAEFAGILADRLRVLGPDHIYTLASRYQLAQWRGVAGDRKGAAEDLAALVADRERVLGQDHPDSAAARESLAYWQGRIAELPDYVRRRSDY